MFERAVAPGELCPTLPPQQGRFIVIGTLRSISEVYISGPIRNFEKIRVAWIETIIRGMVVDHELPAGAEGCDPAPAGII